MNLIPHLRQKIHNVINVGRLPYILYWVICALSLIKKTFPICYITELNDDNRYSVFKEKNVNLYYQYLNCVFTLSVCLSCLFHDICLYSKFVLFFPSYATHIISMLFKFFNYYCVLCSSSSTGIKYIKTSFHKILLRTFKNINASFSNINTSFYKNVNTSFH